MFKFFLFVILLFLSFLLRYLIAKANRCISQAYRDIGRKALSRVPFISILPVCENFSLLDITHLLDILDPRVATHQVVCHFLYHDWFLDKFKSWVAVYYPHLLEPITLAVDTIKAISDESSDSDLDLLVDDFIHKFRPCLESFNPVLSSEEVTALKTGEAVENRVVTSEPSPTPVGDSTSLDARRIKSTISREQLENSLLSNSLSSSIDGSNSVGDSPRNIITRSSPVVQDPSLNRTSGKSPFSLSVTKRL